MPLDGGKWKVTLSGLALDARLDLVTSHKARHQKDGDDEIPIDALGTPTDITTLDASTSAHGLCPKGAGTGTKYLRDDLSWEIPPGSGGVTFGTEAGTACEGNDSRLSDDRDPTAHGASHKSSGGDSIKLDEFAAPDDITDLNTSTLAHGLCPKLPDDSSKYLDGTGAWTTPLGSGMSYPLSGSVYLDGNGNWTIPAASDTVFRPFITIGKTGSGADYICDGVDDNVQIQACLNAATSGSVIFVLYGTYNLSSPVYQLNKDLTIIGFAADGDVVLNISSSQPGVYFRGRQVSSQSLTANASEGDFTVSVASASALAEGDLLVINKEVDWCPVDYPDQKTGEMYYVKSASGSTITLDRSLIRDYPMSDSSKIVAYRPIRMHIENITIRNSDGTGEYEGLELSYCIDSVIKKCKLYDNGRAAVRIYSCYNTSIDDCTIRDSAHSGNGYGISIANASAHINVRRNLVENCRHCIMSGTSDFEALNRDIVIENNVLYGGDVAVAYPLDCHQMTINYTVRGNKIYPRAAYNAFYDGSLDSIFENNEIYGGHAAICRRGTMNDGYHIIRNNYSTSYMFYAGIDSGVGDTIIFDGNVHRGDENWYSIGLDSETFRNIIIKNNRFTDLTNHAIWINTHVDGTNIEIDGNEMHDIHGNAINIDNTGHTNGKVYITNNKISECNANNSTWSSVSITNITNASIMHNAITDANNNHKYGIEEKTGCDYNKIAFNRIENFATAGVLEVGANTVTSHNVGIDI